MKRIVSDRYFLGRKCIFCDKTKLSKLKDKRIKCKSCKKKYSLPKLKRDIQALYYFYLELSASKTAKEVDADYKTIRSRFMEFKKSIKEYCDDQAEKLNGKLEIDESYFGGKRKGDRGGGANNKQIVFGILERKGKVYLKIVENVSAKTLLDAIKSKTKKGSVFYTDGFKSYDSLKQFGKHNIIKHSEDIFAKGHNHINGIEGFWSYAKERFHKYHGIQKNNYPLYLKEMEFRYNFRNEKVFNLLFDICIRRSIGPENG